MPKFKDTTQIQRADLNTGAAAGFETFAATLRGFSDTMTQAAAPKILSQQQMAGQQAFQQGETPVFKTEGFIGGKTAAAFNKGLRSAYVVSIDNDNRETIARFENENPDDLASFNKLAGEYAGATLQNIDPASRPIIEASINNMISSGRTRVQGREIARINQESEDQRSLELKGASDAANLEAFSGQPENAAASLLIAFGAIEAQIEAGDITPAEGQLQRRGVERVAAEESMRGELMRFADSDSIEGAFSQLDEMSKKPEKGFTTQEWRTFTTKLGVELSRKRSRNSAVKNKENREAVEALQDFEKATALGYDIDQEETDRVQSLVAGDEKLTERFNITQTTAIAALMPARDRRAVIAAAETGQLDDVDQYAALLSADSKINKLAREDGYALGISQGLIESVPMDISDPASFVLKQEGADLLSEHYGVGVSPLTDAEAQGLSDSIAGMTAAEKVALAQTLSGSPDVWGQIAGKQAGTFAMAGATGDVALMTAVFNGQELIDEKLATPIKSGDYLADFNDITEGVYGAEDARDIMRAAVAHYASSDRTGDYDTSLFKESVAAVTGGIGKINGFKVELPRGVSENDFEDFIDDMQPATIADMGGVAGITDERAAELVQNGRIRNIKSGEYIVDTDYGALFGADGKPFVIKWSEDAAIKNKAVIEAAGLSRMRLTPEEISRSSQAQSFGGAAPVSANIDNRKRKSPTRGKS